MNEELKDAELLTDRWHSGDTTAWHPLMKHIERFLRDNAEKVFEELSLEEKLVMKKVVVDVFHELIQMEVMDLRRRKGFHSICAFALRRVLVEVFRRATEEK